MTLLKRVVPRAAQSLIIVVLIAGCGSAGRHGVRGSTTGTTAYLSATLGAGCDRAVRQREFAAGTRLPALERVFSLFARPATRRDRQPCAVPGGSGPQVVTIYPRYVRRVGTASDGESVFLMAGTEGPAPPSQKRLAGMTPSRRAAVLRRDRQFTLSLIFVQLFARQGGPGDAAFVSQNSREIEEGLNIAGVGLDNMKALLVGLVPDGVASVQVQYEPHVSFSATVHDNVFLHAISDRFSVGSGDPAELQVWRDRRGAVLRTMINRSDGTIIVERPGHPRLVIPSD